MIRAGVVFVVLTALLLCVIGLFGWLGTLEVALVIVIALAVAVLVWRSGAGRASKEV